jgi:hypothetical protein
MRGSMTSFDGVDGARRSAGSRPDNRVANQ